jgi:hypothetical protein
MDEALETYREAMGTALELGRTVSSRGAGDPGK